MDVGVDNVADTHSGLRGRTQIWFDIAGWIDHGAGRMTSATEQIGNADGAVMEKLLQDHAGFLKA